MTDIQLTDVTVVPEDRGTKWNASAGPDTIHAAQFGTLATHPGTHSYIDSGFIPTVNGTIPAGTAFIRHEGGTQTYDTDTDTFRSWDSPVIFTVELHSNRYGIDFEADAENDVWLAIDLSDVDGDSAYIRYGSNVAEPSDPAIHLGVVDTAAGIVRPSPATNGDLTSINIVEEGATRLSDATGRPDFSTATPINQVIEDVVGKFGEDVNTHLSIAIPDGAYLWDAERDGEQGRLEIDTMGTVEIVGYGQPRVYLDKDVTLVDSNSNATGLPDHFFEIGNHGTVNNCVIKNLEFVICDWAGDPLTPAMTNDGFEVDAGLGRVVFQESATIENIRFTGIRHRYQDVDGDGTVTPGESDEVGGRYTLLVVPQSDDAIGTIKHYHADDGGTHEGGSSDQMGHAIGLGAETSHTGKLVIRDSSIQHFVDNGFYAKAVNGRVKIVDCFAKNNTNSNFRIAGKSVIRDCDLVIDGTYRDGTDWPFDEWTTVGVRVEGDGETAADHSLVDNLEATITEFPGTGSPSIIDVTGGTSGARIRNCTMENTETKVTAIDIADYSGTGEEGRIIVEGNYYYDTNSTSGGSAGDNTFVAAGRDGCIIKNNEVYMTNNPDLSGFYLEKGQMVLEGNYFEHGSGATADAVVIEGNTRDTIISNNQFISGRIHVLGRTGGALVFTGNNFDDSPTHQFDGTVDSSGNDEPSGWEYAANIGIDGTTSSWNNA